MVTPLCVCCLLAQVTSPLCNVTISILKYLEAFIFCVLLSFVAWVIHLPGFAFFLFFVIVDCTIELFHSMKE
jgi:hypothetical protein